MRSQFEARYGFDPGFAFQLPENQTLANILGRASCRSFSEQTIPEGMIEALLGVAFSAPSKSDLQQACVIRVTDREKQKRIAPRDATSRWVTAAPVMLVWCGDSRRIRRLCEWRQHPFANDHLDAFFNASVDVGIAMQTFILAAESVGLRCCPVSEMRDQIDLLSEELALPQWVFPVAGLCVGWPEKPLEISMRLPLSVTVHENTYSDDSMLNDVAAYDRRREAREQTPDSKQRQVEEYGVSEAYGWSEKRTRQYSKPAREDFGGYIRRQGFNLD